MTIWRDESKEQIYTSLYREIELPFPPFIGLDISDEDWNSGTIEKIRWSMEENRFIAQVKDEFPYSDIDGDYTALMLLNSYEKVGWKMYQPASEENA